jgi:formate dehydrogenase major subunit
MPTGALMTISRRRFFGITGGTLLAGATSRLGFDLGPLAARAGEDDLRTKQARKTTSICPYCAVGCGLIVHTYKGRVINVEGDPEHPINQGALCAKGASLWQTVANDQRIIKPLYRAPRSDRWEVKSWEWMLDTIARRVKDLRDRDFVMKNESEQTVCRVESMAHIGSAALDNEECWTLQTMMRALGLVWIEHQARI